MCKHCSSCTRSEQYEANRVQIPFTPMLIEAAFEKLLTCVAANNVDDIADAIFNLGAAARGPERVPDDVTERLLVVLLDEKMNESPLAGHILNFFEFESPYLSTRAKTMCAEFLRAYGDRFNHVHSRQVVVELRFGSYLRGGP